MPRTGRGGSRQGTPGRAYPQRTDLQSVKPLPPTPGPSLQYGQATAMQTAQQAIPMGPAGSTAPPGAPTPTPGGAPPPGPPSPLPGDLGHPLAPTQRPAEPLTTGIPSGPGAGPEALGQPMAPPSPTMQLAALLNTVPQNEQDPQTRALLGALNAGQANLAAP